MNESIRASRLDLNGVSGGIQSCLMRRYVVKPLKRVGVTPGSELSDVTKRLKPMAPSKSPIARSSPVGQAPPNSSTPPAPPRGAGGHCPIGQASAPVH